MNIADRPTSYLQADCDFGLPPRAPRRSRGALSAPPALDVLPGPAGRSPVCWSQHTATRTGEDQIVYTRALFLSKGAYVLLALATFVLFVAFTWMSSSSAGAAGTPSAWWSVTSRMVPGNLPPNGEALVVVQAVDIGDGSTAGRIDFSDTLPAGVSLQSVEYFASPPNEETSDKGRVDLGPNGPKAGIGIDLCKTSSSSVSCSTEATFLGSPIPEYIEPLLPFGHLEMRLKVKAQPGAVTGAGKVQVAGGGAPSTAIAQQFKITEAAPAFGVETFNFVPEEEGGAVDTQAGSHPYQLTTTIALNQGASPLRPPAALRHLRFKLPAGFLGNTTALPECSDLDFRHVVEGGSVDLCPGDTAVGVVTLAIDETKEDTFTVPIFNLVPKRGEPARFGFEVIGVPVTLDTSVRTGSDYGVNVDVNNITQLANFLSSTVTLWGVPGDVSHNASRGWGCISGEEYSAESEQPCERSSQSEPAPFLTMPTNCEEPFATSVEGDSWPLKASPESERASVSFPAQSYSLIDSLARPLAITGCNRLPFSPSLEVAPDGQAASTPTGLTTRVRVPQEVNNNGAGLASSSVRDIDVSLPEGVTLNPAGAGGLEACSEAQIGYLSGESDPPDGELSFTPTLPSFFCPSASKVGTVKIKVPVIENPLEGAVYLATQNANPFGSLVAMYIVAEDPVSGVLIKLPGEVSLSPSGHISASFRNSPQAPFEEAELHFFGGSRAPLATPSHCGTYTTNASFTPWSGTAAVAASSQFEVTTGPNGTGCPSSALPFAPTLTAGTTNIQAGAFSPLVTTISREDGNQDLQTVALHMPPGLSGVLTGVPLCAEAQANAGTCSQASLIGHTIVSVGLGGDPYTVTGGEVFLTEGYGGAPFGLSIVNPAKAGPFDLGKVIVRAKIEVNPLTAALTVTTDPSGPYAIPHVLDGIPLQIKHVSVTIDRQGFTFNPTDCNPLSLSGTIASDEGAAAAVTSPFQISNCAALKFAPKFSVSTAGQTSKAKGASLKVKLAYPAGAPGTYANLAKAKVSLPKQLPSRLTTLQKACTAAVFDANPANCSKDSIVGQAKVLTPILPVPLEGHAYFVSHGGEAFPDLTIVLKGYGVTVELVGSTQIKGGITTSTFKATPDVPFNSFELTLPQGPDSALAANANLCTQKLAMPSEFTAQNGAVLTQSTPISVTGCAKALTRKQKLAKAMKACKKKRNHSKRAGCEAQARKQFGAVVRKKAGGKGK
jgi:hypothetical protein